jgi:carboxyl-terminal processing protease
MPLASLAVITCALATGAGPATPSSGAPAAAIPPRLVDEIAGLVEQKFYSPARLEDVGWRGAVARAREAMARAPDAAGRTAVLRELLASLGTSHTEFHPRDDPAYWALMSIYERYLKQACPRERSPGFPVRRDDIGVFWRELGGEWFVGGIFAQGPADAAGLKLGDRVLSADGRPFSPVRAFAGRAGKPVALELQRARGAAPIQAQVTPRTSGPDDELRQATAGSWRMIEHGGRRVAYLHVWAWASLEVQQEVLQAIAKSNGRRADAFILDLRDGWGGASPSYLGLFSRDVPLLESIARDGEVEPFDQQIRKPTVLLVNGGSRSGKEPFAYGAKKHGLAQLVGERTAGAVTFGQPMCLSDGSLLYLAVADARVDGERLEGRGVEPDVPVPFDVRYAAGRDPQLEKALELLAPAGAGG